MPETEFFIRNSERQSFMECRLQWWWAYVEHWRAIRPSSPLEFGSLVHAALEVRYRPGLVRGQHPAIALKRIYRKYLKDGNPEIMVRVGGKDENDEHRTVDAEELGVHMMNNYVDLYGDESWMEVIAPEMTFQVDVFHPRTGEYLFTMVGQIDGVIRDLRTDEVGFLENKTGSSLEPFGAPLPLDEQSGTYWAFAPAFLIEQGIIDRIEDVTFVLFNRMLKKFADDRPVNEKGQALNQNGTVSKRQPGPLFKREISPRSPTDRINLMRRTRMQAREMQLVREGKLGHYKHPGNHCNWCQFRDMCEVHESGGEWQYIRDAFFEQWDPYEAHEIARERKH